jgi:exopolysaccharide biosynthesis polyprenyl glycosylphosphotransferase
MESSVVSRPIEASPADGRWRTLDRTNDARAREASWTRAYALAEGSALVLGLILITIPMRAGALSAVSPTWSAAFACLVLATLAARGLYRPRLALDFGDDVCAIAVGTAIAAIGTTLAETILHPSAPAVGIALPWATATFSVIAGRALVFTAHTRVRRQPAVGRRTLIVGAGQVGVLLARRFLERGEFGLTPVGFLDADPPELHEEESVDVPLISVDWEAEHVLRDHRIEHVVVSFSGARHDVLLRVVEECERHGVPVSIVPRLFEKVTHKIAVDHVGGLPLLTSYPTDLRSWQVRVKYALDRIVVCLLLPLVLPIFLAAALATWISVGKPIFFRQRRVGRDGRPFDMLKFRSMHHAPAHSDEVVELAPGTAPGGVEGDERRTRVGTFLRRSSLDELPQLFNVLKGEMSIVGPRPERPAFVDLFDHSVYRYRARLRMKSGITGWAQVNGLRGKTSIADRVEWDNHYIENWSLWFDVKVLGRTLSAVFKTGGVE